MNKSLSAIIILFFLILSTPIQPARAQDSSAEARKTLDSLVANYLNNIDSHKYTWNAYGNDRFSKERQKDMTGDYEDLAKKKGAEVGDVSSKPEFKRGLYDIKFKKPYLIQMTVVKSDFIPAAARSLLKGVLLTYRSDKYQDVWWAKPKFSPIALKKSVEKDDAAGALTSSWSSALLNMLYYESNSSGLSMRPDDEFDGRKCKVVRLTYDWTKKPKWNRVKPPFSKFQVPAPIEKIIWSGMLDIEKQKYSHIDYFIDAEKNILLKTEEFVEGEFHWRNAFSNIEMNTLKAEDF